LAEEYNSQKRLASLLFYLLVGLLGYLVYRVFIPFIAALAWSVVFAVVAFPVYRRLARRWGQTAAAFVSTIGVTLIIIVPMVFVVIAFVHQGVTAVQAMQNGLANGRFVKLDEFWARLQNWFPDLGSDDLPTTLRHYGGVAAAYIVTKLGTIIEHTALFFFHVCVTIFALFYLFRDGQPMVKRLKDLLPFEFSHREHMLTQAHQLIFASVTSSVAAAVAHAGLGALAFWCTGLKAPLFWGVMMGFFSFLPAVGSAIIWVPLSISLMAGGHVARGVILLIACVVIVSAVDYLLRPLLIGGETQLGGLLVFIGVVGGITAFGLLGVVLGPIVVALAVSLLDLYVPTKPVSKKAHAGAN
jgi:predicted PurR-regulated permease PerM